jgi:hypothetical protein
MVYKSLANSGDPFICFTRGSTVSLSAAPWSGKNWIVLHQVWDRSTYQSCRGIYSYFFLICYTNRGPRLALHLEREWGEVNLCAYTVYSINTDVKNITYFTVRIKEIVSMKHFNLFFH